MSTARETAYLFPVPEAKALASLIGMRSDMQQVIAYCDLMIARYAGDHLKRSPFDIVGFTTPINVTDWEALSTAACVSYSRCFVSGVREPLKPTLLEQLSPGHRALHEFLFDLRNKHIAHSVNAFEENIITLHIRDTAKSSQEIETVTAQHTNLGGLSIDAPAKLKSLAEWWVIKMDHEMEIQRGNLLRIAHATPLSKLKAYGERQPGPTYDAGRIARRRNQP